LKKGMIAASIVLIGLSLYGIIESLRLERTMQLGIGISFLPLSMSLLIGALAVILLIGILKGRAGIKEGPICEKGGVLRVVTTVALLMGYIFLIEAIGYVPSTFLFFAAMILYLGKSRWAKALLASAAFTFFLYAIFRLWLQSPLPSGFLGV
jgi:putative tricarboxylic transport membrane protein